MTGTEIALTIGTFATLAATIFAAFAANSSVRVALLQKQLAQRQFVIQLWDRMSSLKPIKAADPSPVDVHSAVNTLELVGLCCEGGMIDADVIKRTFSDRFIEMYDMIKACGPMPSLANKSGVDLLRENHAAMTFYDELMQEKKSSGQLKRT